MAAHQYWRLKVIEATQSNYAYIAELILATTPSGSTVTTGGSASSSSALSGTFDAAKAFDANSGTYWSTAASSYPASSGTFYGSEWIQYNLSTPADIVEMRITAFTSSYPLTLILFFSDDGIRWTPQKAFTGLSWTSGETKTFDVTYVAPSPGRTMFKAFRRIGSTLPQSAPVAMPGRTHTGIRFRHFTRPLRSTPGTGRKRIAGTTVLLGVPVPRTVYLLDQRSMQVFDTRHTADDGAYEFEEIANRPYTIVGEDRISAQNSVIYANVTPVD